ncbi:metallophosphoesterase [Helicobacter trogontum]|uniref:Metallophosphoesterase n=1 Tax=Helicobacter trogontum TaxID=50960 RepID=A0A4U8SAX8_9HELI|nr:metallophosphoesterase [Helicobacter trogontum]TLD83146.1 metallophosphoesterase [Helicobacter trogontum]
MAISIRILFFVALVLLHIFIYYMLFKNISTTPVIRHIGKLVVFSNFLCIVVFLKLYHTHIDSMLYTILSSSLGIFWISCNIAFLVFLVTLSIRLSLGAFVLERMQIPIILMAWCAIIALTLLSFYLNAKEPKVTITQIPLKGITKPLNIAVLADMHIDVLMDKKAVASIVKQTNDTMPDIILLGGDIVDNYYHIVEDSVRELANLKAKYGIYYVLGNHEYYYDTYTIIKALNDIGITTLINQAMVLRNLGLNIAGIADLMGKHAKFKDSVLVPDLEKTLAYTDKQYPTILLAHQPKVLKLLQGEEIDLVVSGHTHGGQIFPFHLFVLLDQPFLSGLHSWRHKDKTTQVYVSSGIGWWGMPMRLFERREISVLQIIPG